MNTDRSIKIQATKRMNYLVFEQFYSASDIYADCSDGRWVRRAWRNGRSFGWSRWELA